VLENVEQHNRDGESQPHRDRDAEDILATDCLKGLRDPGEDDLSAADADGESAQDDAHTESRDERADVVADGENPIDQADCDPHQDHRGDDHCSTLALRGEIRAGHGHQSQHVPER
jgi:hypothetical protein